MTIDPDLPVGRYVVEGVEDDAPAPEEEAGIEAALESYRQGRVVDATQRSVVEGYLHRRGGR